MYHHSLGTLRLWYFQTFQFYHMSCHRERFFYFRHHLGKGRTRATYPLLYSFQFLHELGCNALRVYQGGLLWRRHLFPTYHRRPWTPPPYEDGNVRIPLARSFLLLFCGSLRTYSTYGNHDHPFHYLYQWHPHRVWYQAAWDHL